MSRAGYESISPKFSEIKQLYRLFIFFFLFGQNLDTRKNMQFILFHFVLTML